MPNFGGMAYKSNPKAKTGGASPYNSTSGQKPPKNTRGAFNPASATDNITAASTKGPIKGNPKPRVAGRASPY